MQNIGDGHIFLDILPYIQYNEYLSNPAVGASEHSGLFSLTNQCITPVISMHVPNNISNLTNFSSIIYPVITVHALESDTVTVTTDFPR